MSAGCICIYHFVKYARMPEHTEQYFKRCTRNILSVRSWFPIRMKNSKQKIVFPEPFPLSTERWRESSGKGTHIQNWRTECYLVT